jgi:hypothetical protein
MGDTAFASDARVVASDAGGEGDNSSGCGCGCGCGCSCEVDGDVDDEQRNDGKTECCWAAAAEADGGDGERRWRVGDAGEAMSGGE